MTLDIIASDIFAAEECDQFARSVDGFLAAHAAPEVIDRWRADKCVDRATWTAAAEAGLLGISVDEAYGGAGADFRFEAIITKAIGHRGADALTISLHNAVILPYVSTFGTEAQKRHWLPKFCSGECLTAIAMTEPAAGSDLQGMKMVARKCDGGWRLSGQKTFISNGQIADVILVAAKTEPSGGSRSLSLFIVDVRGDPAGFRRGRNLDKVGQEGQDTSELFFDDLFVADDALLGGTEGRGLPQLMEKLPQERLIIAWQAMAMIERALDETIRYTRERPMFGQTLADFQNTQFKLAEYKTQAVVCRVFVDHCTDLLVRGELTAELASMAKYWASEELTKVVDGCLQLFGGYGYMLEYPIARMFRDSRIHRIYGGASEVMKLLIARNL